MDIVKGGCIDEQMARAWKDYQLELAIRPADAVTARIVDPDILSIERIVILEGLVIHAGPGHRFCRGSLRDSSAHQNAARQRQMNLLLDHIRLGPLQALT